MGGINFFPLPELYGRRHVSISNGVMKIPGGPKSHSKDCSGKKEKGEEGGDSQ